MTTTHYQQKFQELHPQLKERISSSEFMDKINRLEEKFDVRLGIVIMRLITNDLPLRELAEFLQKEKKLNELEARKLKVAIFSEIINPLSDDLQRKTFDVKAEKDISAQIPRPESPPPQLVRQPMNLKDIFEEEKGEEEGQWQVVDLFPDADKMKKIKSRQEEQAVRELMDEIKLSLRDEQAKKLKDILRSRLKNVRDAIDTRLALARPADAGGIELSDQDASTVSMLVENYIKNKWPPKLETAQDEEPEPVKETASLPKPPPIDAFPVPDKPKPQTVSAAVPQVPPKKPTPRLIGPIEEFKELTIDEWRRLYANAKEGSVKIKEKIVRLGEESFKKKLEGMRAWQKGEIMKLYLSMGRTSLEKHKPIGKIAEERKVKGEPFLTEEEFHVIMDLNKELRQYQ